MLNFFKFGVEGLYHYGCIIYNSLMIYSNGLLPGLLLLFSELLLLFFFFLCILLVDMVVERKSIWLEFSE